MKRYTLALLISLAPYGCCFSLAKDGEATPGCPVLFEQNERFGIKDETGRVVIEPIYDDAREFVGGFAAVNSGAKFKFEPGPSRRDGGKWGFINEQGKLTVPLTLEWVYDFSDGLAQVADDNGRRFIDAGGKTVINLGRVSQAGNFREGLAPVYLDRSLQKQDWETNSSIRRGLQSSL